MIQLVSTSLLFLPSTALPPGKKGGWLHKKGKTRESTDFPSRLIAELELTFVYHSTINAALEAARDIKSPIIIQFSNGGSAYIAGKGLSNKNQEASIIGAVAGAQVR